MLTLTPQQAFEHLRQDPQAVLIDVRTTSEFSEGHAEQAQNIPLPLLPLRVQELADASRVFFICQSGGRSGQAAGWASAAGVPQAYNIAGGSLAWRDAGLPWVGEDAT